MVEAGRKYKKGLGFMPTDEKWAEDYKRHGFNMLAAGTDQGSRLVETGWKTDLQPFRGEGKRWRAIVRLEPLSPGHWKVDARVRCEQNQNLVSPLDPVRAEWKAAGDDEGATQVLLQHIRARLRPTLELKPPEERPASRTR